ncbi:hypothetical protein CFOL_v3_20270 [Cephalotus follicularis]|uniref:Plant-specific TFIIB-related protein PTF2 n=1 Tax=Cephalotus follicularis TaxID=3775 RepID=A0A1Q3C989_CEPFO|nr:hypothetical protein CFOL_v3_20270 [Cephalotus follicularis]
MSCIECTSRILSCDDVTGNLVCDRCGALQPYNNFQSQTIGISGPLGTYIRVGSSGTGSSLNYKEKKLFEANNLIQDFKDRLKLTEATASKIKTLIDQITDGEFGMGDWFTVLIGASCYVVMRNDHKSLSMAEIAAAIGIDVPELGRMVIRVDNYLKQNSELLESNKMKKKKKEEKLEFPQFDIVVFFKRIVDNLPCLVDLDEDIKDRIRRQGTFLVNCAVKWYLTTGRKPGPLVAAVIAFVAEVNGIVGCRIQVVAKEVHAAVSTCMSRYNEILTRLVEVAQALPWGKDVNTKNIVKNAPFVIQYMEMKSMEKGSGGERRDMEKENVGLDKEDVVRECLRKEVEYGEEAHNEESGGRYSEREDSSGLATLVGGGVDKFNISHECLAMIYSKFAEEVDCRNYFVEREEFRGRRRRTEFGLHECTDWWKGKSDLSKKLLLQDILEKDVGLTVMPPSFVRGCIANQQRRDKIKAAKLRIDKIMHPSNTDTCGNGDTCLSEFVETGKKKRRRRSNGMDWEDFIIETLLLHQVKEEEIEKGHYSTLLDMHVLNSGVL